MKKLINTNGFKSEKGARVRSETVFLHKYRRKCPLENTNSTANISIFQ